MAITKGAKKAHEASLRKKVFNDRRSRAMKEAVKELKAKIVAKDAKAAEKLLPGVYKVIDKAAKRGIIKKNTASRKKSRLVAALKRAETKKK